MDDDEEPYVPGPWELEIRAAWRDAVMPELPLQNPKWGHAVPGRYGFDAEQWLTGKSWDEIATEEESWRAELESPLYYFHPAATAYYLGGYLLEMSLPLEQDQWGSDSSNHFIHFCKAEEFAAMLPFQTQEQRSLLLRFIRTMLENGKPFHLDGDTAAMLEGAAKLL